MADTEKLEDAELEELLNSTIDKPTVVAVECSIDEIRNMITQCSMTEDKESLRPAMKNLKKAILDNPAACSLLLPEDIGQMVDRLNFLNDRDLQAAIESSKSGKKGKGTTKIDLSSAEVQQEILDDLN